MRVGWVGRKRTVKSGWGKDDEKSGLKLSSVGVATVRIDNSDPNRMYKDFWDWLFNDWHIIFLVGLVIGYFYYIITTTEA